MGGRPSALPTAAIAGCSSVCVSLPVWLLSKVANFSSTYAFQDLSFSTNAFSDFPSMNMLVDAIALVPFLRRARALSLSLSVSRSLVFWNPPSSQNANKIIPCWKNQNCSVHEQAPPFFFSSSSFKQNSSQRLANYAGKFLGLYKPDTGKDDLGKESSEVLQVHIKLTNSGSLEIWIMFVPS